MRLQGEREASHQSDGEPPMWDFATRAPRSDNRVRQSRQSHQVFALAEIVAGTTQK